MTEPVARELRHEEHHGVPVLTREAVGDAVKPRGRAAELLRRDAPPAG